MLLWPKFKIDCTANPRKLFASMEVAPSIAPGFWLGAQAFGVLRFCRTTVSPDTDHGLLITALQYSITPLPDACPSFPTRKITKT
jgi:hypothetical protein